MTYNGKELVEFKPTENIVFNPPKKMLVWDNDGWGEEADVIAVFPSRECPVVGVKSAWMHCAEIPEEAPKLATQLQLARWLAEGKGQTMLKAGSYAFSNYTCELRKEQEPVTNSLVRKWGDTEWHEPTLGYMGLEG